MTGSLRRPIFDGLHPSGSTIFASFLTRQALGSFDPFRVGTPLRPNASAPFYRPIEFGLLITNRKKGEVMGESVYKVIELVGTSPTSWEEAAKNAVETASKSLKDLRVAEITKLDMRVEEGKVTAFRARVNLSFKYSSE